MYYFMSVVTNVSDSNQWESLWAPFIGMLYTVYSLFHWQLLKQETEFYQNEEEFQWA